MIELRRDMAVEVVFDDNQDVAIGFQQIDPLTLTKKWEKGKLVWIQYDDNESKRRVLYSTQILTNF